METIKLLGRSYRAIKLAHYREGFGGNIYRSVSTIWKDLPTGLLIYGTYQHISGAPELDDPLIPTESRRRRSSGRRGDAHLVERAVRRAAQRRFDGHQEVGAVRLGGPGVHRGRDQEIDALARAAATTPMRRQNRSTKPCP